MGQSEKFRVFCGTAAYDVIFPKLQGNFYVWFETSHSLMLCVKALQITLLDCEDKTCTKTPTVIVSVIEIRLLEQ